MIRIAICDDSVEHVERLERCLEKFHDVIETEVFYRGSEMLSYIRDQREKYHLYMMDIDLNGENGVDIARQIRRQDDGCLIVFVTSYPEYVYDIFDINVFDYIVKPVGKERINRLMKRVMERLNRQGRIFYYHFNKVSYGLDTDNIYLFQKNRRQVEIHTREGNVLYTYMKMEEIMMQLGNRSFVRVGYSCIVNLKYVEKIVGSVIYIENGMHVNIARKQLQEVKEKHLKYLSKEVWQWSS